MKSAAPFKGPPFGLRLLKTRGSKSQPDRAVELGVHKNTYARWEREEVPVASDALARIVGEGWNANWLLTGEGPERLEDLQVGVQAVSQPVSGDDLSMAIELADKKIASARKAPSREQYFAFVATILEAVVKGLPEAEVLDFSTGRRISGPDEDQSDDGGQGMGGATRRPAGGDSGAAGAGKRGG